MRINSYNRTTLCVNGKHCLCRDGPIELDMFHQRVNNKVHRGFIIIEQLNTVRKTTGLETDGNTRINLFRDSSDSSTPQPLAFCISAECISHLRVQH